MDPDEFETHRPRLAAIAYGMLGNWADADDVAQDAWLRWAATDRSDIREPVAFLTTTVTRLAIDRLRSAQVRRESYVGPWLPEPIVTDGNDPAAAVAEAESLSMTLLTALERLNPVERAVLRLRDVFDFDYGDIAEVVDRDPTAVRQIAVRARDRAGAPRRDTGQPANEHDRLIVERFLAAAVDGEIDKLVRLLAADVVDDAIVSIHSVVNPEKLSCI
ncbi:MAG: sigma-70 family RNA polymerase sigma factor [Nitriliruptoraceae bacterium]